MVCHAIGRCRICARKHKLPVFGSEGNQHALIELVKLRLIVLDTICVECIAKFENVVKEKESTIRSISSNRQSEETESCQNENSITQCAPIEVRPTMHFYVESDENHPAKFTSPYENERLSSPENSNSTEQTVNHQTRNRQSAKAPKTNSTPKKNEKNSATSAKVRAKRRTPNPLCCDFCEKEFGHKGDLRRHKRKHTGEKPYECTECNKKFSQLSNLSRHRLVHSGERPFACAKCGQSYSRKGRLANHIGRELCQRKRRISAQLSQAFKEKQ